LYRTKISAQQNSKQNRTEQYSTVQYSTVVEGNSRFCKVALGIPKIPGNFYGFPGIPGSFGNPSLSQELKRGLPQAEI